MKIKIQQSLNSSVEDAWQILAEGLGDVAEWSSDLTSSALDRPPQIGAIRTCVSSGSFGPFKAGTVKEIVTEFDPDRHAFAYQVQSGLPFFIDQVNSAWKIASKHEHRCEVTIVATIEFKRGLTWLQFLLTPIVKVSMRSGLKRFIEDLRCRVETGMPGPCAQSQVA